MAEAATASALLRQVDELGGAKLERSDEGEDSKPADSASGRSLMSRLIGNGGSTGLTVVIVAALLGGGGAAGSLLGDRGPTQADLDAVKATVATVADDVEEVEDDVALVATSVSDAEKTMLNRTIEQQRWVLDELIKIAENQGKISQALELELDTRVSPKLPAAQ